MTKIRILFLVPLLLVNLYNKVKAQGQGKDSVVITSLNFAPPPFEEPQSIVRLTEEDFKNYIHSELKHIADKIYDSAVAGKINIFKNKELNDPVAIPRIFISNCISATYFNSTDNLSSFDSTLFCYNFNGLFINAIALECKLQDNGKIEVDGNYVRLLRFSENSPYSPILNDSFYLKLSDWVRILDNNDKKLVNDIASFSCLNHSCKHLIINDSLLNVYCSSFMKRIANSWYLGAINNKIIPYSYSNLKYILDKKDLKQKCIITETVSVQIDPNDPYSTKDSTITGEFDKVNGIYGIIGIDILSHHSDKIIFCVAPYRIDSSNPLYYLRWQDAMSVMDEGQKNLLFNVILYKTKDPSW